MHAYHNDTPFEKKSFNISNLKKSQNLKRQVDLVTLIRVKDQELFCGNPMPLSLNVVEFYRYNLNTYLEITPIKCQFYSNGTSLCII